MSAPSVRLLLKGQLVAEVPFRGPMLRIGRMKENEVVINNLSVSRFHATLSREDGRFVLRDLGSENGCWVNGHRVNEAPVGPADSIQIGKHHLELVAGTGEADLDDAPVPRGRSDAWDAAHTYLVGVDTRAKMLGESPAADDAGAEPVLDLVEPEEPALPVPSEEAAGTGVELFGDDAPGDLGGPDLAEFDVSELEVGELPGEAPPAVAEPADVSAPAPPTALLADEEATLLVDDAAAPAAAESPAPETPTAPAAGPLHAGVIVQRGGRLERVVPWEGDRLTLGRAADCDIMLGTAEVSRRHALLVRDGDRYEVRDLESINGTYVNGGRVTRRTLQVGDVIRVEDFELTFVLDRDPLGEAVRPAPPAAPAAPADAGGLTQLGEVLDLAPFVADESADAPNAMSFDADAAEAGAEAAAAEPEAAPERGAPEALSFDDVPSTGDAGAPEALLFEAEPAPEALLIEDVAEAADEEKEELAPALVAATPTVRFELAVRLEELPPALREALASLDEADLRLPVELRLARDRK